MKKLTNLLLGLTLTSIPLFSQEFLPEEFRNYKEIGKEIIIDELPIISGDNFLYKMRFYDVDQDTLEDVVEFYLIIGYSGDDFKTATHPRCYFFDLNKNKKAEDYEWLLDPEMDGLNGNEELFYNKPKEIKPTKIEI